jgi:hypothetical protein
MPPFVPRKVVRKRRRSVFYPAEWLARFTEDTQITESDVAAFDMSTRLFNVLYRHKLRAVDFKDNPTTIKQYRDAGKTTLAEMSHFIHTMQEQRKMPW